MHENWQHFTNDDKRFIQTYIHTYMQFISDTTGP